MEIEKVIEELVINRKIITGITVAYGNVTKNLHYSKGFLDDSGSQSISDDTIIDLASVTKMYTSILIMKLYEEKILDFTKKIEYYSNKFVNILDVKISDIMNFNISLQTSERISTNNTLEKNLALLYGIKKKDNQFPEYNDMNAMVLSLLIEEITGERFGTLIDYYIINKLQLRRTFWNISGIFNKNMFCYDNEYWYMKGILERKTVERGFPHDEKARAFAKESRMMGHAGLYSNINDIVIFAQALLSGKIICENSLRLICNNENIKKMNAPQRFGFLTYTKNPVKYKSEVYACLSDYTFAISGYTGTYFVVDPVNKIFVFIGANRINNRITRTDVDNKESIEIEGKNYIISKNYVYEKDILRDICCDKALEL